MKKLHKLRNLIKTAAMRGLALAVTALVAISAIPVTALADGTREIVRLASEKEAVDPGYLELNDGYLSVKVSKDNGGFLIDTVEGDKLTKADNDKFLVYPDASFDTPFTSFRVTRGDKVTDYIFGRDYGYRGETTSEVTLTQDYDNRIVATWTVGGLTFTQIIALMETNSFQHGMAYITYSVTNHSGADIDDIDARVMVDTALGYQDYAIYMLGQSDGSYTTVERERTVSGTDYNNYFFAYDSETAPTVTAYTLNATVGGEVIVPEKVTFAHWANLASTEFDYEPSTSDPLNFTTPYNLDHLVADSAFAMYYPMGEAKNGSASTKQVGLYYGVYSNVNATDAAVAINFTTSGSMFLNDEKSAYKDINGRLAGNYSITMKVQNTSDETIDKLAIAVYPGEDILPYDENGRLIEGKTLQDPYYRQLTGLKPGETRDVRLDFSIDPTYEDDYRKINLKFFDTSRMSELDEDENLILEQETYVLCPSAKNAKISFTGISPTNVYKTGRRFLYVTGENFVLLRNTAAYRVIARPLDGGNDVLIPAENVVVDTERETATLILEGELTLGTWQIIIDYNDAGIEDVVSEALRINVSDNRSYLTGLYGLVTVIRTGTGADSKYSIRSFASEEAYARAKLDPYSVMLELRGDFSVMYEYEEDDYEGRNPHAIRYEALSINGAAPSTISGALEIRDGRVTVTPYYDSDWNMTSIDVDIDGEVFTVGANTRVWDGVCALTTFENGKQFSLIEYNSMGERDAVVGDTIGLLWPSAAGAAQTLVGLVFNFRYCEFGIMAQKDGSLRRVITFSAELNPNFLIPNGKEYSVARKSAKDNAQVNIAGTNYRAKDLRLMETRYEREQRQWLAEQAGTLYMYVPDILFGGEFIGFNTQVEVGIPAMIEGMPYIQGSLHLKVMNKEWEFGVEGVADMMIFKMEVELRLKSYNSIPVPDTIRFYVESTPGIPLDPFGVFWIKGVGAGIDNIYETFFAGEIIPPLTLIISGGFALFNVLEARADLELSMRHIAVSLSDVGIAGISLIDRVSGRITWYPYFDLGFGIRVDLFDAIVGEGSIYVKQGYSEGDEFFFQAFARAVVKIPDSIWLIGGTEIGSAAIGIDTKKVWGSVKVIGIGIGLTYYWGSGDVDVDLGASYDVPEPVMPLSAVAIYTDEETGRTLYVDTSNVKLLATGEGSTGIDKTVIASDSARLLHKLTLDPDADQDALLAFAFPAESALAASDYKDRITLSVGGAEVRLRWLDSAYPADHEINRNANAILRYDAETGMATASISVTDGAMFGREITVSTPVAAEASVYGIERLVDFDSLTVEGDVAILRGDRLAELHSLDLYAQDAEGISYRLATVDPASIAADATELRIPLEIPSNLMSGDYTLAAVGNVRSESGADVASPMAETAFSYVNPDQPLGVKSATAALGGNYTYSLTLETEETDYDGFITSIYEMKADGTLADTVFKSTRYETAEKTVKIGGRYASTADDGTVTYTGLEAGKRYLVEVTTYRETEDGSILPSVTYTVETPEMVTPTVITPSFSVDGALLLSVGATPVRIDSLSRNALTVKIGGIPEGTVGTYRLNAGDPIAWNGGNVSFSDLEDGLYTLYLNGTGPKGDAFAAAYQFAVDTTAPALMISSPQGGGFFEGDILTVTGISEAGARIIATVEDGAPIESVADATGQFTLMLPMDMSLAYQRISLKAADAVGNTSDATVFTMTNGLLGDPALQAVILLGDREVTGIVTDTEGVELTFGFRAGDRYVRLNRYSAAAARVEWGVRVISKSASVSDAGVLVGAEGARGIVTARLDGYSAYAEFAPVDFATVKAAISLPEAGIVYDGLPKTPTLRFDGDDQLTEGVDYKIGYANNVNAGTASLIVTALENGRCIGVRFFSFTIKARPISDATVTLSGGGKQPGVTVKIGDTVLVKDVDYKLTYLTDKRLEKGYVSVTGIGNYEGIVSSSYTFKVFHHSNWIVPTAFTVVLGGAALALFLLRRRKLKRERGVIEDTPET